MARLGVAVLQALLVAAAAAAWLPTPASGGGVADFGGLEALLIAGPAGGAAGVGRKATTTCSGAGAVGECDVDEDEELGLGGLLVRRSMAQQRRQPTNRYISYAALRADQVPCNRRGKSYYTNNCASQQKANPYRRGCSAITRCQRNTN